MVETRVCDGPSACFAVSASTRNGLTEVMLSCSHTGCHCGVSTVTVSGGSGTGVGVSIRAVSRSLKYLPKRSNSPLRRSVRAMLRYSCRVVLNRLRSATSLFGSWSKNFFHFGRYSSSSRFTVKGVRDTGFGSASPACRNFFSVQYLFQHSNAQSCRPATAHSSRYAAISLSSGHVICRSISRHTSRARLTSPILVRPSMAMR
mmetsp:Transcript_4172/g.13276  ORF Transcript_4172/g.13276 Transcript_4172/m.13276 type:complete len:203 (-) Transcript_4172:573-1181(-)